ncbi:MAG: MBG domain-containing protein [Gemmataceae bacterium]
MPGAADITISPAAAAALSISGFPTGAGVGVADPFTVSVIDAFGNVASNYTGTIHFSSGDPLAALPADYHFQASDSGVQNFSATFNTPGVQTLDVVDLANSAISGSFFTTGQAAVFNFDTGSPTLTAGMGIPLTQTAGAVSAHFSSPNSWLAGGFSIQSHNTTFFNLDQFSGNYLYPNSVYNPNLAISFTDPTGAFSQPLSRISFTFATADFQQTEIPTTVRLTAYLGSTIVGTASGHGAYTGQTMPQGTLTFDGAGQVFDRVLIEIPWAPLAASDMLLDNFQVSTPDAFGVVVNAPTAPSTPTLALGGNLFAYDGAAHAATAAALGVDGVSPVAGSFSFTYNGSTTPPTDAGVYNVVASFTSADPNYADATISGSLVIDPAAPTLSLSAGSYLYDTAAHAAGAVALGVDGVTPVAGSFSFTYNGSATAPTNAGVYTVVASFTSG